MTMAISRREVMRRSISGAAGLLLAHRVVCSVPVRASNARVEGVPPSNRGQDARDTTLHGVTTSGKEIVVVQGLIDLLVRTPGGLLVIDFKTDRVSGGDVPKRAEAYRGQLELYARAAAAICRDKVLERWLYFLAPRQAVQA